jgi:uncharacterized membrane protein YbhN (UPF0104 family)
MLAAKTKSLLRERATALKSALTLGFIVMGVIYVAQHFDDFRATALRSILTVFIVIAGFVASVFFRALYNYFTSRHLGAHLSFLESFMLSSVVTAGNIILPASPGAAFRALYLKRVHRFPYAHFASSTALFIIITSLMMAVFGLVLLLLIELRLDYFRIDLFLVLLTIGIVMSSGLILGKYKASSNTSTTWSSFKRGYVDLTSAKKLVVVCVLVVSSNFIIASAVWIMALRDYAPEISILESFLFSASQIASGLVNLTPGAAGFQEVVGIYVGHSFSISTTELFTALVWVRVVRTITAIALGTVSALSLRLRIDRQSTR